MCCRGRPLEGCGPWLREGFCIFWRRWLNVLVVLVESRLGLDDHGGMIEASGLHWPLYRTRSMEVCYRLLCDAHRCTPFASTLTCSRTVGPQQLPSWPNPRLKLNQTRRNKAEIQTTSLSRRMNTSSVCRSTPPPFERVSMFTASSERILKAKVNVIRKDKVHWVSAPLHWLHLSRSLTPLRPQTYLVKVRRS